MTCLLCLPGSKSLWNDQEHTGTFNWTKQWYPIASEIDMDPAKPHSLMLLGMPALLYPLMGPLVGLV